MVSAVQTKMRGEPHRYAVYFLYFFYVGVNAHTHSSSHNSRNLLKRLLGSHSSKSVVVILNLGNKPRASEFKELNNLEDDVNEHESDEVHRHHDSSSSDENDDLYYLNYMLRKAQDKDSSDSSSSSASEDYPLEIDLKQALRTALRARCQKVDHCVQKCPPKKPSCPVNCQQVFDNLNLCAPPTTTPSCEKTWGKTMPPRWRL